MRKESLHVQYSLSPEVSKRAVRKLQIPQKLTLDNLQIAMSSSLLRSSLEWQRYLMSRIREYLMFA